MSKEKQEATIVAEKNSIKDLKIKNSNTSLEIETIEDLFYAIKFLDIKAVKEVSQENWKKFLGLNEYAAPSAEHDIKGGGRGTYKPQCIEIAEKIQNLLDQKYEEKYKDEVAEIATHVSSAILNYNPEFNGYAIRILQKLQKKDFEISSILTDYWLVNADNVTTKVTQSGVNASDAEIDTLFKFAPQIMKIGVNKYNPNLQIKQIQHDKHIEKYVFFQEVIKRCDRDILQNTDNSSLKDYLQYSSKASSPIFFKDYLIDNLFENQNFSIQSQASQDNVYNFIKDLYFSVPKHQKYYDEFVANILLSGIRLGNINYTKNILENKSHTMGSANFKFDALTIFSKSPDQLVFKDKNAAVDLLIRKIEIKLEQTNQMHHQLTAALESINKKTEDIDINCNITSANVLAEPTDDLES